MGREVMNSRKGTLSLMLCNMHVEHYGEEQFNF